MSISNNSDDFYEGRDISVEEFKKRELLSFYNHFTEADLLVISNRNLHLMAIHQEFLKFSMFISRPLNKKHFDVFLIPVFQHLYLLIRSQCGKSDARRFISYYRHLIPPDVNDSLLKCETCEDLQLLIYRSPRIRVKLSSEAYHILMNWFRDCFSESVEMFNILRVLHENFHVDIYPDKDDEDFAAVEMAVLRSIKNWMDDHDAKTQKKSGPKISFETCETPQSDVDDYDAQDSQKKSSPEVSAETCKTTQMEDYDAQDSQKKLSPEVSAETCKTTQSDDDILAQKMSEFVFDSEPETSKMSEPEPQLETFKISQLQPETPKIFEPESKTSKMSELEPQLETSKVSELQPETAKMSEPETSKTSYLEPEPETTKMSDLEPTEISGLEPESQPEISKMSELEPEMPETPLTSESNDSESSEIKSSMFKLRPAARKVLDKARRFGWDLEKTEEALLNLNIDDFSEKDDEEMDFQEDPVPKSDENAGLSPLEPTVSPGDSEYVILSEASTERNDDDILVQENIDNQDLNDGNNEDGIQVQENTDDQDLNDVTTKGIEDGKPLSGTKHYFHTFKNSYKTNFHSAYPVTISGKDVLCSSDVSSDFLYLACGFESCKICTWRLCCEDVSVRGANDFKLQPLGTLRGHKGIVYALSIDSKMKSLISGSHDKTVRIWDLETNECLSEIQAHSAPVYTVCASPNSSYFLSASEDKDVVLFWYDDLYPVRVYSGHSMEAINCVKFHPNCSYFASASNDGNLFLFKINDDRCPVRMFRKHIAKVYTLAFSPCGKYLASADVEGMLVTWNILTYAPIAIYETGQGIRSISYDMSGSFIAAVFFYKSWKVYSVEEDNISSVIEAQSAGVPKSVHFSTDNKMLIIQYIEADKSEIAATKEKPKTEITKVN